MLVVRKNPKRRGRRAAANSGLSTSAQKLRKKLLNDNRVILANPRIVEMSDTEDEVVVVPAARGGGGGGGRRNSRQARGLAPFRRGRSAGASYGWFGTNAPAPISLAQAAAHFNQYYANKPRARTRDLNRINSRTVLDERYLRGKGPALYDFPGVDDIGFKRTVMKPGRHGKRTSNNYIGRSGEARKKRLALMGF